jgi:hypothetical protein
MSELMGSTEITERGRAQQNGSQRNSAQIRRQCGGISQLRPATCNPGAPAAGAARRGECMRVMTDEININFRQRAGQAPGLRGGRLPSVATSD